MLCRKPTRKVSLDSRFDTISSVQLSTHSSISLTRAMTSKRQPTEQTLRQCMREIVAALKDPGRQYYFFGRVSYQLLRKTPRPTADVDLVIENSSNTLPDPRDWLADESIFWSGRHSQYAWVTTLEEDDDEDTILYQGCCFVEIDINVAGWGSFPHFETIRDALVQLPGGCGLSLPRNELLKLKLAGWAERSRREGPRKWNDMLDIVALRVVMYVEGEILDQDSMTANMKEGLKLWLHEMTDDAEWRQIGLLL
jgi:hypothetical protein